MEILRADGEEFAIGRATTDDVAAIVALLRDDTLGTGREVDDLEPYQRAFAAVEADPSQYLAVVRSAEVAPQGEICATMQLTLIPGLSRGGATRLQVEAVRVGASARGLGLGTAMFAWAHDYARTHGATLSQLTSDKRRADAHRFYEGLGYLASHEGLKLEL